MEQKFSFNQDDSQVMSQSGRYTRSTNVNTSQESQRTTGRSISPIQRGDNRSVDTSQILKPVMLLDIDDKGIIKINRQALDYIRNLNTRIAVISIVGPYRTGKSYLLNRFAGVQKGFQLGSSTNPCTRGIWIWGKPIKLSDDLHLLLLDTEGLASYTRDENIDAKLFTLTALMSSTMVYNVMQSIDEKAIESLSFIANLTKYLSMEQRSNQEEDVSLYFPELVWVVRDFALMLVSKDKTPITPKEYMENCLSAVQSETDEAMAKNKIRRAICNYFKVRSCHTLIRPVDNEDELRHMEKLPYDKLKPGFREASEHLIDTVLRNVRPKVIKGVTVEGPIFSELIVDYVDALNNHAIPSIPSTWERIIDRELVKFQQAAIDFYMKNIKRETDGKLPMNDEPLNKIKNNLKNKAEEILREYKYSDFKFQIAKEKVLKKIEDVNGFLDLENMKQSKERCNIFAQKLIEKLDNNVKNGRYKHISQLTREFNLYRKTYLEETHGPAKYEIFANFFVENYLKVIENYHSQAQQDWEKQLADVDKNLSEVVGRRDALNLLLKQEKENGQSILDEYKSRADETRQDMKRRLAELTDHYTEKLEEAEKWKRKLESENEDLKNMIDILKVNSQYNAQTVEIEKSKKKGGVQATVALPENVASKEDVLLIQQSFKGDIDFISHAAKTLLSEVKKVNDERFQSRLEYEKEREKNNLEKKFNQQLLEAKTLSEQTIDNLRNSYEREIKVLREEMRKVEKSKENTVVALLEKEAKIKILEEKILNYVKENKTQIDHADMLVKISDQLLKLMKKIDKGSQYEY